MQLELDLMELNDIYYALASQTKQYETDAKEHGGWFIHQHEKHKALTAKIQELMYEEAEAIDEEINSIITKK